MSHASDSSQEVNRTAAVFATTKWTQVLLAREPNSTEAREALAELCRNYWYPLYAFIRRSGCGREDAEDLVQEFFSRLLARQWLNQVDQSKGRFRSFLLAALKHFLANERDKARAIKRGGGHQAIPLDAAAAETRYQLEPADRDSPDRIFERRWAMMLLDRTLARLREEHAREGKEAVFELLKDCLAGSRESLPYAELAVRLEVSQPAVKVMVHRFRQRYRELLRQEVAPTVADRRQIEDELRHLINALRGPM